MKRIFSFILISVIVLIITTTCNVSLVLANPSYSGTVEPGNGSVPGGNGPGGWDSKFGFFIKVYDKDNKLRDYTRVNVNNSFKDGVNITLNNWIYKNAKGAWIQNPATLANYLNIPIITNGVIGSGNYENLINKLPVTLNKDDYVIIEPFTYINRQLYSFRGIVSNSSDSGYKNSEGQSMKFYQWYESAARILANAAKVGSNITVGGNTYIVPEKNECTASMYGSGKWCGYNTNKYIGYGLIVVRYDQIYTEVEEYYLDLNGFLDGISSGNILGYGTADIYINGELVEDNVSDYWQKHPKGTTYEIKDINPRPNKQYNGVYSGLVSGTINSNTEVVLNFSSINSCENDFKQKLANGLTIEERLELFQNWGRRSLLNLSLDSEEEARDACTTFEHSPTPIAGCINGNLETGFDSNNLSYYDEIIDIDGVPAFCGLNFNINNNVGTSSFPTIKAGMLILGRSELNKTIANGTIIKTCYTLYDGNKNVFEDKSYSDYISDEKLSLSTGINSINQIEVIYGEDPEVSGPSKLENGLNKYEIVYSANYNLKEWFAKLGSGEIMNSNCSTCRSLGYGIYSKLNSNQNLGTINFLYEYGGTNYSGECTYSTENEIIDPNGNNLNIEFRTIQTSNAFPGKDGDGRVVGDNWCNGSDCNSSNDLIANVMNNRNDSYNKKGSIPLYRIVLTPTLIKSIREYNKTNPYDDYTLECDVNNKCKSEFLENYGFTRTTEEIQWLEDYEEKLDKISSHEIYETDEGIMLNINLNNNKYNYLYDMYKKYDNSISGAHEQFVIEMEAMIQTKKQELNKIFEYAYKNFSFNNVCIYVPGPKNKEYWDSEFSNNPYCITAIPINSSNTEFEYRLNAAF